MDQPATGSRTRGVKRPMNAFLIFCKQHRSIVHENNPKSDNRNVTKILGELWSELKPEEKSKYTDLANRYKEAFLRANPDYKWHSSERSSSSCSPKTCLQSANIAEDKQMRDDHFDKLALGKLADPTKMGGLRQLLPSEYSLDHLTNQTVPASCCQLSPKEMSKSPSSDHSPSLTAEVAAKSTLSTSSSGTSALWSSWKRKRSSSLDDTDKILTSPCNDIVPKPINNPESFAGSNLGDSINNHLIPNGHGRLSISEGPLINQELRSEFNGTTMKSSQSILGPTSVPSIDSTTGSSDKSILMQLAELCTSELLNNECSVASVQEPKDPYCYNHTRVSSGAPSALKTQDSFPSPSENNNKNNNTINALTKIENQSICSMANQPSLSLANENSSSSKQLIMSGQMLVDHIIDRIFHSEREESTADNVDSSNCSTVSKLCHNDQTSPNIQTNKKTRATTSLGSSLCNGGNRDPLAYRSMNTFEDGGSIRGDECDTLPVRSRKMSESCLVTSENVMTSMSNLNYPNAYVDGSSLFQKQIELVNANTKVPISAHENKRVRSESEGGSLSRMSDRMKPPKKRLYSLTLMSGDNDAPHITSSDVLSDMINGVSTSIISTRYNSYPNSSNGVCSVVNGTKVLTSNSNCVPFEKNNNNLSESDHHNVSGRPSGVHYAGSNGNYIDVQRNGLSHLVDASHGKRRDVCTPGNSATTSTFTTLNKPISNSSLTETRHASANEDRMGIFKNHLRSVSSVSQHSVTSNETPLLCSYLRTPKLHNCSPHDKIMSPAIVDFRNQLSRETGKVRKSKRRNRGQRYLELINEGFINPTKERLAALQFDNFSESLSSVKGQQDVQSLDENTEVINSRNTNTDKKHLLPNNFDLEAHIANLPTCSIGSLSKKKQVSKGSEKGSYQKNPVSPHGQHSFSRLKSDQSPKRLLSYSCPMPSDLIYRSISTTCGHKVVNFNYTSSGETRAHQVAISGYEIDSTRVVITDTGSQPGRKSCYAAVEENGILPKTKSISTKLVNDYLDKIDDDSVGDITLQQGNKHSQLESKTPLEASVINVPSQPSNYDKVKVATSSEDKQIIAFQKSAHEYKNALYTAINDAIDQVLISESFHSGKRGMDNGQIKLLDHLNDTYPLVSSVCSI